MQSNTLVQILFGFACIVHLPWFWPLIQLHQSKPEVKGEQALLVQTEAFLVYTGSGALEQTLHQWLDRWLLESRQIPTDKASEVQREHCLDEPSINGIWHKWRWVAFIGTLWSPPRWELDTWSRNRSDPHLWHWETKVISGKGLLAPLIHLALLS